MKLDIALCRCAEHEGKIPDARSAPFVCCVWPGAYSITLEMRPIPHMSSTSSLGSNELNGAQRCPSHTYVPAFICMISVFPSQVSATASIPMRGFFVHAIEACNGLPRTRSTSKTVFHLG